MGEAEVSDLTRVVLSEFVTKRGAPCFIDASTGAESTKPDLSAFHAAVRSRGAVCVLLAAGQGSRFVSDTPKVIHPYAAAGAAPLPLAAVSMGAAAACGMPTVVIVGHARDRVVETLAKHADGNHPVVFVVQNEQMGTGHAVYLASYALPDDYQGDAVITYADNPGVDGVLLEQLAAQHAQLKKGDGGSSYGALILTGSRSDAGSGAEAYGRIIRARKDGGDVVDIVEKKTILKLKADNAGREYGDVAWTAEELYEGDEFNSGIVMARAESYMKVLGATTASQTKFNPPKYEYYATDFVKGLLANGITTQGWKIPTKEIWKLEGANTVDELRELEAKSAERAKAV